MIGNTKIWIRLFLSLCLIIAIALLALRQTTVLADVNQDSTEQVSVQLQSVPEEGQNSRKLKVQQTVPRVPGASPAFQIDTSQKTKSSRVLRSSFFKKSLSEWIGRLQPNQGGIIWLSILVMIIVAFDFKKPISWRNLDLLLLLALSFLFVDIIRFSTGLEKPIKFALSGIVFLGIFLVTAVLLIRALVRGLTRQNEPWFPNLSSSALVALLIILLFCNTLLALSRYPDDCGKFTNIGAARMIQTGKFPYNDQKLRGGAAATYGPVLYLAYIPFQLGISAFKILVEPDSRPLVYYALAPDHPEYVRPPILTAKLTLLFFHFIGVLALIMIGKKLVSLPVGLGLACLYAGSAYVQGIGGEKFFITGMTFISHIAPAAVTLLAFAALNRPLLSGALLAAGAGTLFYPAFFFPLWLGYYFWHSKDWHKFAAGFLVVCAIIFTTVLLMTPHSPGESSFHAIYESTVGHQEAKEAYGSSTFSFWGTHPKIAAFWQKPLVKKWYLLKPSFLLFAIFISSSFFLIRARNVSQLAFLTAAVAIAIQLWKSHAGGTYVEWYYPFFLIGLFAQKNEEAASQPVQGNTDFQNHRDKSVESQPI